jgi:hypothetical protein
MSRQRGGNPAGRACPEEADLVGVDPGVRARRLDRADGIGRDEVEMAVDVRAALAL